MKHRILVVEDEPAVLRGVQDALQYHRLSRRDGGGRPARVELARDEPFDLIVLDLMLPRLDGFEVLRRLRDDSVHTPVLILTARGQESDRVRGLELGADDYVVKPFSVRGTGRARAAHLRRRATDAGVTERVCLGEAEFDFRRREAYRNGDTIPVLPKEIDLARFLMENRGRVVCHARRAAPQGLGVPRQRPAERTVDNYVIKLRQKVSRTPPARGGSSPCGARGTGLRTRNRLFSLFVFLVAVPSAPRSSWARPGSSASRRCSWNASARR